MSVTQRLARAARPVVRRLPPSAQHSLRSVYWSIRPAQPPPPRHIALPDDVGDAAALREFLADTDLLSDVPDQIENYLGDSLERFRITMALMPRLGSSASVLELGASPYFFTRMLLRRGLQPTLVNYWGDDADVSSREPTVVRSPRRGAVDTFTFDYFNVERDRFPYADEAFDVVLCCELLEHMPHDPTHLLAEIHRVLKEGSGRLLLTTPNAARWELLAASRAGGNMYETLSGYGVHGRHNREYTVAELQRLLEECGYGADVFAHDIHPHPICRELLQPGVAVADRGCNLFAVAVARDEPRWAYPDWLYSSRHAFRRVVRPDLRVGFNHDVQAWGFAGPVARPDGEALLLEPGRPGTVLLEAAPQSPRAVWVAGAFDGDTPTSLTCRVGDGELTLPVGPRPGLFALTFPLPHDGRFTAELTADGSGVEVTAVRSAGGQGGASGL